MISESELDVDSEVIDVDPTGTDSARVKTLIPCRNGCQACPHGPFEYEVLRGEDDFKWQYVGRGSQ